MLHGMSEERIRTDVEELCGFADRLAGTDAERRASNHVARRLTEEGRRVETEAIYCQPQWALVHFMHCALAAIGSMISALEPPVGFAMVLLAAASAYLDLSGRFYLLRRLLFRRSSQNVRTLGFGRTGGPTVVLCANVDAPRTGAAYERLPTALQNLAARRAPIASGPTRLWFWSIALLLPTVGARMAGFEPSWLAFPQLPPTMVLIVACFLLGEIALSPASPGANANASGVAAVLEALRRVDEQPTDHVRVEAALLGAGETTMEGMRALLRRHRTDLDPEATWFISLESVGRGDPRYLVSQGPAASLPMDRELVELCAVLCEPAAPEEEPRAEPLRDGRLSAAFAARTRGYPALAITCREDDLALPRHHHTPRDTPAEVDPAAILRASSLAVDVIRLLDRELGRRQGGVPDALEPHPRHAPIRRRLVRR